MRLASRVLPTLNETLTRLRLQRLDPAKSLLTNAIQQPAYDLEKQYLQLSQYWRRQPLGRVSSQQLTLLIMHLCKVEAPAAAWRLYQCSWSQMTLSCRKALVHGIIGGLISSEQWSKVVEVMKTLNELQHCTPMKNKVPVFVTRRRKGVVKQKAVNDPTIQTMLQDTETNTQSKQLITPELCQDILTAALDQLQYAVVTQIMCLMHQNGILANGDTYQRAADLCLRHRDDKHALMYVACAMKHGRWHHNVQKLYQVLDTIGLMKSDYWTAICKALKTLRLLKVTPNRTLKYALLRCVARSSPNEAQGAWLMHYLTLTQSNVTKKPRSFKGALRAPRK